MASCSEQPMGHEIWNISFPYTTETTYHIWKYWPNSSWEENVNKGQTKLMMVDVNS